MGYSLSMMADFPNALISGIIRFFLQRFFAQNNSKSFVQWIFSCFLEFYFLSQIEDFLWVIVLA